MRKIWAVCLVWFAIFLTGGPVYGCYGGKPLSMGGAYISLAEGPISIYWNPAGLAFTPQGYAFSSTVTTPIDVLNYSRFYGITIVNQASAGVGLGYTELATWSPSQEWFQLSMGFRGDEKNALGLTIRREEYVGGYSHLGWDFGWQYRSGGLSLGLLIQDAGESWSNIRPGIAYQYKQFTVAVNGYDVGDRNGVEGYMAGVEFRPFSFIALRAGSYLENITYGVGLNWKDMSVDYAFLGDDLGDVHHITFGYRW